MAFGAFLPQVCCATSQSPYEPGGGSSFIFILLLRKLNLGKMGTNLLSHQECHFQPLPYMQIPFHP